MAILSVANVEMAFGQRVILDGVNFSLERGQHVGLVGINGCGKSSLMKLIAGLGGLKPDAGSVQIGRGVRVGYLTQDPDLDLSLTLREEAGRAFAALAELHRKLNDVAEEMGTAEGDALDRLLKQYERLEQDMHAAGGYSVDHQIDATLHGLGLSDEFFNVPVDQLSGGQKGRLALAKLLLSQPDVLLLDEPTNHLDIAGRQWLEQFLASYDGAVMLVSHDRWLLDHSVNLIFELEAGRLVEYPGNYQKFRELRVERREAQQRVFEKQQDRIRQEKAFIDRYKAGQRAKQAKGREKRLERFVDQNVVSRPLELDEASFDMKQPTRSGDLVIVTENLAKGYEGKPLFSELTLSIKRGERIGIIGPNGAGKSTLIRALLGEETPDVGAAKLGSQLSIGHYRQTHEHLDTSQTVVEYLQKFTPNGIDQEARNLAGAFLFSGMDQDKPLNVLSGGERSRAVLAGLVVGGHNLLILDEPTNHLDIPSAERLEGALLQFAGLVNRRPSDRHFGTLILITHDRMLLENVVDQLLVLDGNGGIEHFLGTYSEYEASKHAAAAASQAVAQNAAAQAEKQKARVKEKEQQRTKDRDRDKQKQNAAGQSNSSSNKNRRNDSAGQRNANKAPRKGPHAKMTMQNLEKRIEEVEKEIIAYDDKLADPELYKDRKKWSEIHDKRERVAAELKPLEQEWTARADDV